MFISEAGRFHDNPAVDVTAMRTLSIPIKTRNKAQWAYRQLQEWRQWKLSTLRSDQQLQDYEAILLQNQELFSLSNHKLDIVVSNFIAQARNTLDVEKNSAPEGVNKAPRQCDSISKEDEDKL